MHVQIFNEIVLLNRVFKLLKVPNTNKIVINDSFSGVSIIDITSNYRVDFHLDNNYFLNSLNNTEWLIKNDGKQLLTINGIKKKCWLVDLDSNWKNEYEYNINYEVRDVRYTWDDNLFFLVLGKVPGTVIVDLDTTNKPFSYGSTLTMHKEFPQWAKSIKFINTFHHNVIKVNNSTEEFLFHDFLENIELIGIANWRLKEKWTFSFVRPISNERWYESENEIELNPGLRYSYIKMAGCYEYLFLLYKDECFLIKKDGHTESLFKANLGEEFQDIEFIKNENQKFLVVASTVKDSPNPGKLTIYTVLD